MTTRFSRVAGFACLLPFLVAIGCGPAHTRGPARACLEELAAEYAEIIDNLPNHPGAAQMVEELLSAAVAEAADSGLQPGELLMYRFANGKLGLYMFDLACAGIEKDPALTLELCARIQAKAPSTPIARAALNLELRLLAESDETAFINRIDNILEQGVETPEARVAVFTRAEHSARSGKYKVAAVEFMRFWALFPDHVPRIDAADTIMAALRAGGFFHEAETLALAAHPGNAAGRFLAEFEGAETVSEKNLTGLYLQFADADQLRAEAEQFLAHNTAARHERAMLLMRLAMLYAREWNHSQVARVYGALCSELDALVEESTDCGILALVTEGCRAALVNLQRLANQLPNDTSLARRRNENTKLLLSLSDSCLAIALASAQTDDGRENAGLFEVVVREYVQIATGAGDRDRPIRAYRMFVDEFPASPDSPEMLLALAEFLNSKLQLTSQACAVYQEIADNYPDAPQVPMAMNKKTLVLYESGRFEDAYQESQLLIARFPSSQQAHYAAFTSAICEAAMGLTDLAEQNLSGFVKENPQSPLAPKGLMWLASQMLAQQNYGDARHYLETLLERYPQSAESSAAKEYLSRLARIPD